MNQVSALTKNCEPGNALHHKIDVLIIGTAPPPLGGVAIHIMRLTKRLKEHDITFMILDEGRVIKPRVLRMRTISPLNYMKAMANARTIHIHSSNHYLRLVHTLAARMLRCRVVHTVHSARGSAAALLALYLASLFAHNRIAVSAEVAGRLGGATDVVPAFVPPTPDEEIIPSDIEAWMRRQSAQGRRVIAFNAFNPSKIDGIDLYGIDMVIDAFKDMRLRKSFAAIICISLTETYDNYYQLLLNRAEERGLTSQIRFQTGQIGFAGVLQRADLFVRPTISDGDAISVREAIWYGVPAIASDAVRRPEGTIIFPSRDVRAFADAIWSAPERGSERVGEDFSNKIIRILQADDGR